MPDYINGSYVITYKEVHPDLNKYLTLDDCPDHPRTSQEDGFFITGWGNQNGAGDQPNITSLQQWMGHAFQDQFPELLFDSDDIGDLPDPVQEIICNAEYDGVSIHFTCPVTNNRDGISEGCAWTSAYNLRKTGYDPATAATMLSTNIQHFVAYMAGEIYCLCAERPVSQETEYYGGITTVQKQNDQYSPHIPPNDFLDDLVDNIDISEEEARLARSIQWQH